MCVLPTRSSTLNKSFGNYNHLHVCKLSLYTFQFETHELFTKVNFLAFEHGCEHLHFWVVNFDARFIGIRRRFTIWITGRVPYFGKQVFSKMIDECSVVLLVLCLTTLKGPVVSPVLSKSEIEEHFLSRMKRLNAAVFPSSMKEGFEMYL